MRRIAISLLVLLACADVAAREVRLSSPDSGGGAEPAVPAKVEARKPAPAVRDAAPEARVRPSVHGDAGTVPRARWHSFLPGMFR
ncbi:hypothetical protein [Cognatilysobacter segetis]|uniref:hypothetical protein n=2 Tax=Cognatilysobacter segetis TaxID=2492394 RepID=UPI00138FB704